MQFSDLKLLQPLQKAVEEMGYTSPSPIQEQAIPPVLQGRDLLGCAQTGTGKTAAFALPILQRLMADAQGAESKGKGGKTRPIRVLVLTPTRELALQIDESFVAYGKYLPLRSTVIFGGVGQAPQVAALKKGVDILVATPGRLNDLIGQGYVRLEALDVFVLDEADRMLDMGFVQDVKKVIRVLPQKRQTLLFSATMPDEIVKLADSLLHDPAKVFVTPASTTVEAIEQQLYKVDKANKRHLLANLLRQQAVASALVFTRTKHGADRVVRELKREGILAAAIHGNKSQTARQDALARFKDGRIPVLVATDIAARGLDISELSHVFNYDLPNIPETYVHRIGRTGRAGNDGIAISFCCAEELPYLKDIEKLIGFSVPEVKGHAWPMDETAEPTKSAVQAAKPKQTGQKDKKQAAKDPQQSGAAKGKKDMAGIARAPEERKKNKQAAGQGAGGMAVAGKREDEDTAMRRQNKPKKVNREEGNSTTGGARNIVTKRPVWSTVQDDTAGQKPQGNNARDARPVQGRSAGGGQQQAPGKKEEDAAGKNRRRRGKRGQGGERQAEPKERQERRNENAHPPEIRKDERGLFDFSEEELAQDTSLRVIGDTDRGEAKYANFEDYLKDH